MKKLIINQDVLLRIPITVFKTKNKRSIKCKLFKNKLLKMIKRLERLKNTVNKYMADI
jgi:hypothetical protein